MSEPKLNYNSTPDEVEAIILGKFPDEYEKGVVNMFCGDLRKEPEEVEELRESAKDLQDRIDRAREAFENEEPEALAEALE